MNRVAPRCSSRTPRMHVSIGTMLASLALPAASPAAMADPAFYANSFEKVPSPAAMTDLGRSLFFDPSLSASGRLACGTCHDPAHHFGPRDGKAVQYGGRTGREPGRRAVPSLTYTQAIPPFTEHFNDDDGDDGKDQGPAGGRTWDGRAPSAHDQARAPLFSPFEMANASEAEVVDKARRAPYAGKFQDTFGPHVLDDEARAFKAVILALEVFQQSPTEFYPYTSKYDAWLRGQATLTADEKRGLELFNSPLQGDCARCHPSAIRNGAFPQFTDYGFVALGLPRNGEIPANRDSRYFDLGLCGPLRTDLADQSQYCGMFRTPSLRNVAARSVFFHNGAAHTLRDAVRFYAERDTSPGRWYPRRPDGGISTFNDLPARYRDNIERGPPFGQRPGDPARLTEGDINDIVAFLQTLTDGFVPPHMSGTGSISGGELSHCGEIEGRRQPAEFRVPLPE